MPLSEYHEVIEALVPHRLNEPLGTRVQVRRADQVRHLFPSLDIEDRNEWPRQHAQFQAVLEKFSRCFRPRVKLLHLEDASEEEAETVGV